MYFLIYKKNNNNRIYLPLPLPTKKTSNDLYIILCTTYTPAPLNLKVISKFFTAIV